ncbi:anthranilate synthase component 2 [Conidiobolus coronatus NRRL 28638]|uniref:Multifunctional tryptophan biosynthesis protein n=1 Tax=Conidiobolus coronatus (strain ATCC 28846 / CBS 209.66 / NRRL 28638) TaxID=796925 RepID=A0A137PAS2_CONC2|nr:anthranilate synthase component 2 [Conidiobolus coronatus NRRL 28638]|eukprot:KXN72120.1 anthranilate synthase component 2 [Conidiobolus coronatus NRRL 28638]
MTTVLIDNYDSFTWNVYEYLSNSGADVQVFRNDKVSLEEIIQLNPRNLVISPGPGNPSDSGISMDAIRHYAGKIPILGVCLGHQCIFEIYGGTVEFAGEIVHGETSDITHDGKGLYSGVPQQIATTRYHSLAGNPSTIPKDLVITSKTDSGTIQGIRHREYCMEGVQFHPESILSGHGHTMIQNFLKWEKGTWRENGLYEEFISLDITPKVPKDGANPAGSILDKIAHQRLKDVKEDSNVPGRSFQQLEQLIQLGLAPPPIDFYKRLRQTPGKTAVMAEIKRASPSKGNIQLDALAPQIGLKYADMGASVISVLTEPKWFKGSLKDLEQVRTAISRYPNRPAVLRKDFIVEPYQVLEARLAGADAILLIVAILSEVQLRSLFELTHRLGMEALVEVNNEKEMELALKIGSKVIGVNNRNLHTFDVDMKTTSRLANMVPEGVILAALSGIATREDVAQYESEGVSAILVGETLMRHENPKAIFNELIGNSKTNSQESLIPTTRPRIKICGVRTPEAAVQAAKSGADLIGMIFAKSKRQVSIEEASQIVKAVKELPVQSKSNTIQSQSNPNWFQIQATKISNADRPQLVGVFQNQSLDHIQSVIDQVGLDLVQFHGDEPLEWARFIKVPVIKVFHVSEDLSQESLMYTPHYHSLVCLDAKPKDQAHSGGHGVTFDWLIHSKLNEKSEKTNQYLPIILAGGLTPENVIEGIKQTQPYAVDVSSGIETDGQKDLEKIKKFCENVYSLY